MQKLKNSTSHSWAVLSLLLVGITSVLVACGGGGGSSSSTTATPAAQATGVSGTYTASAAAGEVLSYTVDTNALKYSYTITHSAYGLEGKTGSGTLTKNSDGSYTPSESPTSKVYALPNGLLMGAVVLTIQGHAETVPIIGVQNPVTSLSSLAGTYNYVSTSCSNASYGVPNKSGCNTNYGTLKIDSAGNYFQCTQTNITSTPNCYNSQTTSGSQGTVSALGGGVFKYVKTGSNAVSYILAFNAPNGETVVIGDLNDPVYYGYGQFVASTQPASNLTTAQFSAQANGTWYYHDIYSDNGAPTRSGVSSGTHLLSGTGYTNADGSSGTSTINTPWAGFVTTTNPNGSSGVTILAGNGVYVWRSSDSRVYEYQVGMHQ